MNYKTEIDKIQRSITSKNRKSQYNLLEKYNKDLSLKLATTKSGDIKPINEKKRLDVLSGVRNFMTEKWIQSYSSKPVENLNELIDEFDQTYYNNLDIDYVGNIEISNDGTNETVMAFVPSTYLLTKRDLSNMLNKYVKANAFYVVDVKMHGSYQRTQQISVLSSDNINQFINLIFSMIHYYPDAFVDDFSLVITRVYNVLPEVEDLYDNVKIDEKITNCFIAILKCVRPELIEWLNEYNDNMEFYGIDRKGRETVASKCKINYEIYNKSSRIWEKFHKFEKKKTIKILADNDHAILIESGNLKCDAITIPNDVWLSDDISFVDNIDEIYNSCKSTLVHGLYDNDKNLLAVSSVQKNKSKKNKIKIYKRKDIFPSCIDESEYESYKYVNTRVGFYFKKFIENNEFETIADKNLLELISKSIHYPVPTSFTKNQDELNDDVADGFDFNSNYGSFDLSPYFNLYGIPLSEPDDFYKQIPDEIQDEVLKKTGWSIITNIDLSSCHEYIRQVNYLADNESYSNLRLMRLKQLGAKFTIKSGCWTNFTSTTIWKPSEYENTYKGKKNANNPTFGRLMPNDDTCLYESIKAKNKKELQSCIYSLWGTIRSVDYEKLELTYEKKMGSSSKKYPHVYSYIIDYAILAVIDKIVQIPFEHILKVKTDAIFVKSFTDKPIENKIESTNPTKVQNLKHISSIFITEITDNYIVADGQQIPMSKIKIMDDGSYFVITDESMKNETYYKIVKDDSKVGLDAYVGIEITKAVKLIKTTSTNKLAYSHIFDELDASIGIDNIKDVKSTKTTNQKTERVKLDYSHIFGELKPEVPGLWKKEKHIKINEEAFTQQYMNTYKPIKPKLNYINVPKFTNAHLNIPSRIAIFGPPGSGKTYEYTKKIKLYNLSISAPTNERKRAFIDDGFNALTNHKLFNLNCTKENKNKNTAKIYNHICDEAYMITDSAFTTILDDSRLKYHRLILTLDQYQLPPVIPMNMRNEISDILYMINNSWTKIILTKIKRTRDPKYAKLIEKYKERIVNNIIDIDENDFGVISYDQLKEQYTLNDIILGSRNDNNDALNDYFESKFCNDENNMIPVIFKKKCNNYEINERAFIHSYDYDETIHKRSFANTIHVVQGKTIKTGKIFILMNRLFEKAMFYVAISRGINLNQIVLVDNSSLDMISLDEC
jgi:hypothetical protein